MIKKSFTYLGSVVMGLVLLCTAQVSAQTTVSFSSSATGVLMGDGNYNGTEGSMTAKTIAVAGIPAGAVVNSIVLKTNIGHTWVGDLTLKLKAPDAKILALMSRAGLAEPNDGTTFTCCGSSSDLVIGNTTTFADGAATTSENIGTLGVTIPTTTVAASNGAIAAPPAFTTFAALATALGNSSALNGNWTFLAGDGAGGDQGTIGTITMEITYTVADPCVAVCPPNVTINLDAGECSAFYNYNVTFTGNCQATVLAPGSITQNGNTDIIQDALQCGVNPMRHFRAYDLVAQGVNGSFTMQSLKCASWSPGTVQVFVYTYTGVLPSATLDPNLMTLVGQSNATAFGNMQVQNVPLTANTVIPANGKFVVEQRQIAGGPWCIASNYQGNTQPAYIACPNGFFFPATINSYNAVGYGYMMPIQQCNGLVTSVGLPVVEQVAGIPSGGEFPIGTTQNCFNVTDPFTGEILDDCCFDVTVLEYPFPNSSLACNDLVQISVDENCQAIIGADDVLEGGPYGCYDDYIVELDKTAPFGNGPWVPAIVGPADIGKTYQVRVTDPETGNKCWGNVKIEDKIPPVLECVDKLLPCNFNTDPNYFETATLTLKYSGDESLPLSVPDNTEREIEINVNAPAGAVINDVDFELRVDGDVWFGNIDVELESPSGTVLQVWQDVGGCTGPLWARFDDEGSTALTCVDFTTGANAFIPFGFGVLSVFDNEDPNGTWKVRVADDDGFGDQNTWTVANLYINMTGTLNACLPNGLVIGENAFPNGTNTYVVPAGYLDACSDVTLTYIDTENEQDCESGLTATIARKWTATDASGNKSTCTQYIDLLRPTIVDVVVPPDYDGIDAPAISCADNAYPTPEWLEGVGLQGGPYVFGAPEGCSIGWDYDDIVIDVCDGTYKIRRVWTLIDWCSGEGYEHNQILKVMDNVGPTIACPSNLTVTTDPFTCCATIDLPDAIIEDNCSRINNISAMVIGFDPFTGEQIGMFSVGGSLTDFPGNNHWDLDTLGQWGYTPCLPLGTHTVIYTAEDDCGNTSTCSFRVTVRDYTPPVAACDEYTVVSIGIDDPFDCYLPDPNGCDFAGVTWVKATTFDDGSYDNCGDVYFTVRRMAPYSDCILGLNQVNGHPNCDDVFADFPSEFERAISEYDSIKFYCCEVGTTQTVILRVYQLDVNGNISVGPDGTPIYNECMIQVEVQDKIKPVCQSPAHVTVSCENFDPSLWAYGIPNVYDNCCLDQTKVYQDQCGLTHTVSYTNFDTVCNKGTLVRTFRAFDCHGFSSQCTQRVVVQYEQDYFVKFPNDVIVTTCDGTGNYGEPILNGEDCEQMGISFEDEIYTVVPDACFKIERTWHIINWCTYNPNLPCIYVPNPNPNPAVNHPTNLPGPTVSAPGTPAPWAPTVVKINPTDPQATNYSLFWDADANCYEYKQIIKIIDTQDPVVDCPASPVEICDLTANDPLFWNEMYWWDAVTGSHDLCEAPTDLTITGTDACSGANISFRYLLFLDLDGDGTMETVVSSTNLPGWNNVNFGNIGNPNYSGGTPRSFDGRPVPFNQKYGFALQTTVSGNNKTASVRWNTQSAQNSFVIPQLPYGTHKIKWFVEDGCGNETICEYTFVVKDCKKPTVVCLNGLSVNIMQTGMITLWASDFLQYTEDNCTPANLIKIGIVESDESTGSFPVDGAGNPLTSVTFDCTELGGQPVQLWAIDLAGNADFCETYVLVQDNMGICNPGSMATVAGALQTTNNEGLEESSVELDGSHPAFPPINLFDMSDNTGSYMFGQAVPMAGNYTVTPTNDNNPLNGVTTFDLVLMSKHILGLEPLNTPYKLIAADINKSNSVTTYDIVELRKLILGIYTELPQNSSWRFADKSFTFADPQNPWIFPETKTVANVLNNQFSDDFVAIKIGDLNGSALPNSLVSADDRTTGTLLFDVEDRTVTAGEEFTVNFKAAEKVLGYQFTLNFNGLEVVDLVPGAEMTKENFGVFAEAITTSFDGNTAGEFAVKFRAKGAGRLSQMLGVSSRITKSEAYTDSRERLEVALRYDGKTIAGVGFELYQNAPNPFINKTFIGFHLPEATEATLTIFDETGRMLFTQTGDFAKGYNAIAIDKAQLNATGVLYYKVETATASATKKMIQTK